MKNRLSDLNNHLFAQLERLSDEDTKGKELQEEITRSQAVTSVSKQIITNAALVLKARKIVAEGMLRAEDGPKMLGIIGDES